MGMWVAASTSTFECHDLSHPSSTHTHTHTRATIKRVRRLAHTRPNLYTHPHTTHNTHTHTQCGTMRRARRLALFSAPYLHYTTHLAVATDGEISQWKDRGVLEHCACISSLRHVPPPSIFSGGGGWWYEDEPRMRGDGFRLVAY